MSAGDTCRRVAAIRALASENAHHPYSEPLTEILAGTDQLTFMRETHSRKSSSDGESSPPPKIVDTVVIRAMMLDHLLLEECTQDDDDCGCIQIVILGAGMDARADRLKMPGSRNIKWFEVDQDEVVTIKEVSKNGMEHSENNNNKVVRLKLDLAVNLDQLFPSLEANGFDPSDRTIYTLEGLLHCVPLEGITKLFDALASVPKSTMLVTMIDQEMLQDVHAQAASSSNEQPESIRRTMQNMSQIWKTDLSDVSFSLLVVCLS